MGFWGAAPVPLIDPGCFHGLLLGEGVTALCDCALRTLLKGLFKGVKSTFSRKKTNVLLDEGP